MRTLDAKSASNSTGSDRGVMKEKNGQMAKSEIAQQQLEKSYIRLLLFCGGALVATILFFWGGCHFAGEFQERRAVRRANGFISGGNLKEAALSARRALQANPSNVGALRIMAEVAERSDDRTAVDWRRKAVEVKRSTDDLLALSKTALQFKEVGVAADALEKVDATDKETPGYHSAVARLAEAQHDLARAETEAARAATLAPNDKSYQLQLALLQLQIPEKRESAVAILTTLRADPKFRLTATRMLLADGIAHGAPATASRDLAQELQAYPEAGFAERLMYLDILHQMHDPAFASYLTQLENEAPTKTGELAALVAWMNRSSLSAVAVQFLHSLPAATTNGWPVPLLLADAYSNLADWKPLEDLARDTHWPNSEYLRHAFLARAYRGEGKADLALREWQAALRDASADAKQLTVLAHTVSDWHWDAETTDLLWQMAKQPETQLEAVGALYQRYMQAADTAGLHRVFARMAEIDPNDLTVQNNLAQAALLLDGDTPFAAKIAAELYARDPKNAAYATTHAFALYKAGKIPEARQVLESISSDQLEDPSIDLYYGVILVAAGEKERAIPFLQRAARGTKLLPEEKTLLADARRRAGIE